MFVVLAFLEALSPPMKRQVEPCTVSGKKVVQCHVGECSIVRQRLHVGILSFEGGKVKNLRCDVMASIPLGEMASKCHCETKKCYIW